MLFPVPCSLSLTCAHHGCTSTTRSRDLAMHALLKHTLSDTANLELHNHLGLSPSKELFLLRLSVVLHKSEHRLLVDLVLVIPPSLVPTDLVLICVWDSS